MPPRHLLLLLLLLPLLPAGSGCVFCRLGYLEIRQRFHKLCEDYMRAQGSENCTRHPGPSSFNQFAIDDETLLFVTEKTHRVFRFLEIKRDVLGIAEYWDWLHEVKLPELTYEALCPPLCVDWTYAYNCTLCRVKSMKCFDKETCFPVKQGLRWPLNLIFMSCAISTLVGVFTCCYEFRNLPPGVSPTH